MQIVIEIQPFSKHKILILIVCVTYVPAKKVTKTQQTKHIVSV